MQDQRRACIKDYDTSSDSGGWIKAPQDGKLKYIGYSLRYMMVPGMDSSIERRNSFICWHGPNLDA